MADTITIVLDGFPEQVPADITIAELIERHRAAHKDLVVEVNGRFVHVRDYPTTRLAEGSRVEFILAAFGG